MAWVLKSLFLARLGTVGIPVGNPVLPLHTVNPIVA